MATQQDYYKILGISRNATKAEIKAAYKKRAVKCHPDKFACAREEIKAQKTIEFQLLNEAYSCLCDEKSRRIYNASHSWESGDKVHYPQGYYRADTKRNIFSFNIGSYFSPWLAASVCLVIAARMFQRSSLYIYLFNMWGYKITVLEYSVVILFVLYFLYRHYRNI